MPSTEWAERYEPVIKVVEGAHLKWDQEEGSGVLAVDVPGDVNLQVFVADPWDMWLEGAGWTWRISVNVDDGDPLWVDCLYLPEVTQMLGVVLFLCRVLMLQSGFRLQMESAFTEAITSIENSIRDSTNQS